MSQTFFSKLDLHEKSNRLNQLGKSSRNKVTVWMKGKKDKYSFLVLKFDKDRQEVVLDSTEDCFFSGANVLCTFELRGMIFFSEVVFKKAPGECGALQFINDLFKSERRSNYRLLTFPIYEVWAKFDIGEVYDGGKVVNMKSKTNQTQLFKNFLKIVNGQEEVGLKKRVQDLSASGMAIHVSELEVHYFMKDKIFKDVKITFSDESIVVPEVEVVCVVDYIGSDKNIKKYKVGLHFTNLSSKLDDLLGKKINKLLREFDSNKDFENFLK